MNDQVISMNDQRISRNEALGLPWIIMGEISSRKTRPWTLSTIWIIGPAENRCCQLLVICPIVDISSLLPFWL